MGYIVLSKRQVAGNNINGSLNVKLCKDKASANLQRKQLHEKNYDVVILDKIDCDLLSKSTFKDWVNGGYNNPDPIWNGPSEDLLVNSSDEHTNSDKHNLFNIMELGDKYFGGDDEQVNLGPKRFYADEDFDEYYLSSNGNRYYLFSKVVTLKGDRQSTIYTFGKKEWSKTNDLTLLRFCNIPYDKCVVENKSGYPFLKTEVTLDEETPSWVEKENKKRQLEMMRQQHLLNKEEEDRLLNELRMKYNDHDKHLRDNNKNEII